MMVQYKKNLKGFLIIISAMCFVALILLQCSQLAKYDSFLENNQGSIKVGFLDFYEPSAQMEDEPQSVSTIVEMKYGKLPGRSFKLFLQNWFSVIRESAALIMTIYIAAFITFFVMDSSRRELIVVHLKHGKK